MPLEPGTTLGPYASEEREPTSTYKPFADLADLLKRNT